MADPKYALEAALYAALDAALSWPVFNGYALVDGFDYVIVTPAGGIDDHHRLRAYDYEYQIVAVSLDRAAALAQAAAIDAAIEASSLAVAGFDLPWKQRTTVVDYSQHLDDNRPLWLVGGIYLFHVREQLEV